jgi:hypothetical protein
MGWLVYAERMLPGRDESCTDIIRPTDRKGQTLK